MPLAYRHLIDLPKVPNLRGNLTVIEVGKHPPFEVPRYSANPGRGQGFGAAAMRNLFFKSFEIT